MMQEVEFAGGLTSRIGFGCGRLTGGAATRESRASIEQARLMGIRYFDVAPSYGLGLAENVLGDVLATDREVMVTTKVGIGRPKAGGAKSFVRQALLPIVESLPSLKARLTRAASAKTERGLFEASQIEASLGESLKRLRRSFVNGLLLHEVGALDVCDVLDETMKRIVDERQALAIGSGTSSVAAHLTPFGTVAQFRYVVGDDIPAQDNTNKVLHGIMRYNRKPPTFSPRQIAALRKLGRDHNDPNCWAGTLLTLALSEHPTAIVLLSSSSSLRLRSAIGAIDWVTLKSLSADALATMRSVAY